MNPENSHRNSRIIILLIVLLIVAAGVIGWLFGQNKTSQPSSTTNSAAQSNANSSENTAKPENVSETSVEALVTYTLPDGWKEVACPSSETIYVIPSSGTSVNCDNNPSSPIKFAVDPANNTDCNQLQSVQNVSKHICVSEYINGKKSLKSETVYNADSSYKKPTTVNAYHINIGGKVIKVEYIHDPSNNEYQAAFDELSKSVKAK